MSSFEIFKSMFITPRKKLKRARMTKFKSIYDFKTENFLCPIDNKDKNSKDIKSTNNNCVTNSNDFFLRNRNQLEIKVKDKVKLNFTKLSFLQENGKKSIIEKNGNNFNKINRKTIQLNNLFCHQSNCSNNKLSGFLENRNYTKSIEEKDEEKNSKKTQRILKYIQKRKMKKKSLTPNILNYNSGNKNIIQIPNHNNNFQTRNFNNIIVKKSPSYRINEFKEDDIGNLKEFQNKKLKLKVKNLHINIRNSMEKFRKICKHSFLFDNKINYLINDNIKERKINISEDYLNNAQNSSLSNKNISEKNNNNIFLINDYANINKLKTLKDNRNDIQKKQNFPAKLIASALSKDSIKNLFSQKLIKKSNLKIKLENKINFEPTESINLEKKEEIKVNPEINKETEEKNEIKEIKLKPTTIKDINLIKKFSNNSEDEIGRQKLEKYEIGKTIGKGEYAVVKIGINKTTNKKYALKIYEKGKLDISFRKTCVNSEIEVLYLINHKNIVKIIEDINTYNQIIIVQELVEGLSLKQYYSNELKNKNYLSDKDLNILKNIFKQIFEAMNYLHQNNISHRDIKMENILIKNNYEIKIIDFGFGLYNPNHDVQKFFCGTPKYIAPEILEGKGYLGEEVDLWSLGVLIYKIFCNIYPFKGRDDEELYSSIKKGKYTIPDNIPNYIKNIIEKLLIVEPKLRIKCENILNSFWLKD